MVTSWLPRDRAQLKEMALQWQWQPAGRQEPQDHEDEDGVERSPSLLGTGIGPAGGFTLPTLLTAAAASDTKAASSSSSSASAYSKNYCARTSLINFWRSGNGYTLPCQCNPCMCLPQLGTSLLNYDHHVTSLRFPFALILALNFTYYTPYL